MRADALTNVSSCMLVSKSQVINATLTIFIVVLYCIKLYHIVLHCIALHNIVLHALNALCMFFVQEMKDSNTIQYIQNTKTQHNTIPVIRNITTHYKC